MRQELLLVVLVSQSDELGRVGGRGDGAAVGEGHQAGPEVEPGQLLDAGLLLVLNVVVLGPLLVGLDQAAVLAVGEVGALNAPADDGLQLLRGDVVQELEGAVGVLAGDGDAEAGAAREGTGAAVALGGDAGQNHGEGNQHVGGIVGLQGVQTNLDHGALVVQTRDAAGADLGLVLLIGLHEHLGVGDAQVPHGVEHLAELLLEVLIHDDLGLEGLGVNDGQTVVLVADQEAGAAVLHGGRTPRLGGLGHADGALTVVGGVGRDVVDDQLLPLVKGLDLGVARLLEQVHVQVVARRGVRSVLGCMGAEPVDLAVVLRHQLHLGSGEAVLHVDGVVDVVVERDERAGRVEVAGSVRGGHHVGVLASRDEQRGLLTHVRTDQVLDLELDVGLALQILAHGGVGPGVDGRGRRGHVQQREGSGFPLRLSGSSGRIVLRGSIRSRSIRSGGLGCVGGRRLGGRAARQRRQHHHQRDEDGDGLSHGHSGFLLFVVRRPLRTP